MRKGLVGLAVAAMVMAPSMVLAQEKKEQPELAPVPVQQPQQQAPQAYPASDGAPQYPQQPYQPTGEQPYTPTGEQPYTPTGEQPQYQMQTPPPGFFPQAQPQSQESFQPQQNFQPQYEQPQQQYAGSPFYANRNYDYGMGGPANYTGYAQQPSYGQWGPPGAMLHPRVATAPAGLTINVELQTAISTQVAHDGDFVQAKIAQNVPLSGLSYIPAGSTISGQVTEATSGRMMNRSGSLGVEFNKLQLPSGQSVPIQAHVLGNIGKYADKNGVYHGEGWGSKIAGFAERAAIGAGGGALFGTALGGITGRVGTGAWAGTAIGGGLGAVDDVFLRRGKNVLIKSGTPMQIQLDDAVEVPVDMPQSAYGAS